MSRGLAVLAIEVVQGLVLGGLGLILGWHPQWSGLPLAVAWWLLGTAALVPLAMWLAGTLRAEAVLAGANLLWVLMLGLGLVVPVDVLPDPMAAVARFTPGGALGELLRSAWQGGPTGWSNVAVLVAWAVIGISATMRWFRWSD